MNILPVPYVSQLQQGALGHNNDCGAAAALMILRAYSLRKDYTVDRLYDSIQPTGDVYLSASGIRASFTTAYLQSEWKAGMTINDLFGSLVEKKPVIALVNYGILVDAKYTQKTSFRGAHFLVVNGMDIINVCIKDSYRDDGKENVDVPINVFLKSWSQCNLQGNPNNGGIIPSVPIQDLSSGNSVGIAYTFNSTTNGINVRSLPSIAGQWIRTIWKAQTPILYIIKIGGINNNWGLLSTGEGWICLDYFVKV